MARTLACWGAILSASLLLINLPQWTQSYRLESYNKFSDNLIQNNDDDQFKCSTGCIETSKSNRVIDYQTGTTYSYQVQLSTELKQGQGTYSNDVVDNNNSNSQVRIKAIADLSAYGQCEMVLRLKQIQIEGIDDQRQADQMKYQLAKHSTHFAIKNGQIEQVCAEHDETEWTVNVKKSILSSIQVSAENLTEKSEIIETDINGQCLTEYQPINEWKYGQDRNAIVEIIKRKQLSKCHNRHQINLGLFPRSYGLDQLVRSSMPIVNGTYECRQKIQDSVVIESDCRDKQSIWPLKVSVDSSIHCQLIGEQSILIAPKSTSRSMKRQNLAWNTAYSTNSLLQGSLQSSSQDAEYTVEQVEQLLKQLCRKTQNSIDIEVPELFAQLVSVKQSLRAEEDQQLYEQIRNGQLCQSSTNKLHDIYLDASALAGTAGSVDVLIKAYHQQQQQQRQQRQSEILPRFSYYFSLLAFTKVPSVEAAQRLVEFVQQQQQQIVSNDEYEQIIYGVTGYLHNLRRFVQDQEQQQGQQGQQQHGQQERISLENVEQVISRLQQYLIEQLEQLVPQVGQQQQQQQQQVNYTTVLSLIHGLENIGYELTTDYQQQQQLVQRVIRIVQQYGGGHQSKSVDYYTPIRVAIIRSIVNVVTDDDTVRNYLLELFFDQQHQESNAVRIEAYKTLVMSGVKISELQKIQKYVDSSNDDDGQLSTDVINYVRSHQANLRTTSDIYRRTILPLGAPKFSKPTSLIGVSRNYEFSYVNDVYQIGVTAEADIVYDNVYGQTYRQRQTTNVIPQMVTFNLTLPIMGREFQVVQVRVYQQGLEQVFGSQYQQQSIHDKSTFDPMKMMTKLIDIVSRANGRQLLRENPQFTLYVQIQIDGKTVVAYDEQELITLINGHGMISRMLRDVFTRQQSTVSIDRAFSIVPIDFLTSMTTTTGMPVQFRLNSTVVVGLKANVNLNIDNNDSTNVDFEVWPSFVGQIDGSVKYYAGQQQEKSVQHTGRVYSAPHVNLQARFDGKQGVTLKSYMPEQRYTVLRYETGFYVNKQRQQSRSVGQGRSSMIIDRSSNTGSDKHQCTEFTKKLLGVALCYDVQYQNNDDDGQSTEFVTELSVEKFDQQLNSFEIHLDNPVTFVESIFGWSNTNNNNGKRSLKFMFNTPGTEIDRETVFEVQLPSFDRDFLTSGARLRIKSPWKEMLAEAVVRNHQYDRTFSVQFSVDKHRFVQMEIGLETVQRGQKSEYRAKMIVNTPFTGQPINLVGTWSYQRGSKSVFHISLEDIEQQRSFVKGTWIKSGQISQNDFKWSSHLMFDLARIACKAIGTIEQGERDFKLNFSTDYQTPRSGRQSAQLSVKHQNLSYGKMIKLINEAQWSSTVAPKYNTQYNHRFIFGSNDYLEHDLQIKSNNNNEEQIRLFQSAKLMEQRGQYDGEIDSICTVKPLGIDYELKAQTSLVGWTNGGGENRRFELIATGNRRNQIDSDKLRAELYFQQQSSEPLKMTVRAAVKSEQIDFMYTDKVEEQQPNEYHGLMMVQLSPKQKYSTRYVYSVNQRDSKSNIHQLDATINDAITNKLFAKQQGKMIQSISDRSFDLQSKWTDEYGQRLFDGRLKVENGGHGGGQTKCQFEHYPTDTRGRFDLDSSKAVVEFENKQYKHMTKVDLDNERQFSLNSKTKQYDNDIFTIDTKISPKHRSYLKIDSESFNSDCHYEPESETGDQGKKSAKIQLRIPGLWEHETQTLMDNDNDRYELQSRTDYNNENLYDLNDNERSIKRFQRQIFEGDPSNSSFEMTAAWIELMAVYSSKHNESIKDLFVVKEQQIDQQSKLIDQNNLNLFNLNILNESIINVNMTNNEQQVDIMFNGFHLSIDYNLKWTIHNVIDDDDDHNNNEPLNMIKIQGDTITMILNDSRNDMDITLNITWTPQRHYTVIDVEIKSLLQQSNIGTITIRSMNRPERKNALMFGHISILELIDETFPDDPFFSADNMTTLLRQDKNLRQSLCYHWLMYNRINHTEYELQICHRINDLCNLISHFVRQKQLFRTPNPCLSCIVKQSTTINHNHNGHDNNNYIQRVRFGSRQTIDDNDQAQIIYLLDGTCHQIEQPKMTLRFLLQLKRLSKVFERLFRAQKIKTEFSLVTVNQDGQYEQIWSPLQPESQLTIDFLLKFRYRNLKPIRSPNGTFIWNETMFRQQFWPTNGHHTLDFLYQFAYSPPRTSRHFIMIDCGHNDNDNNMTKQTTCRENDVDFNTARNILLQSSNYFHVITGYDLTQRTFNSPKMRHVIGIDWRQVIFEQQIAAISKTNSKHGQSNVAQWLRQHITPNRDICHVLALETNGSVFNHRALKQVNRSTFVGRIVANHQTKQCQRCDCTLAKDYLIAQHECFLCQTRSHTVLNRWNDGSHNNSNSNSNQSNGDYSPQEWTDIDEQQLQEFAGSSSDDNDNDNHHQSDTENF